MVQCMSPLKPLVTTDEAVAMLGAAGYEVSPESLRRWVREGRLPAIRKGLSIGRGSRLLFRREDIEALLRPSTAGAA